MRTHSTKDRKPDTRNSDANVGWVPRIVTSLLFACQAASVLLHAYLREQAGGDGMSTEGFLALGMMFFAFPPLGILGVTWAIWSTVKRWETRPIAIAFLLVSVAMSTSILPFYVSRSMGPLLRPWAQTRAAEAAHRGKANYLAQQTAHYDALRQRFRTPQRVAEARGKWLRLADGCVLELIDVYRAAQDDRTFESWASENLVGREVRVALPDRSYFDDSYVAGATKGFHNPRPRDPGTGTQYGNIPAVVLLEGGIVNTRFSRNPKAFEAWYREHVAKNM